MRALEERCHAVESLVGILLSIPDKRAVSLLSELSEHPYARGVLETVNNSAFGMRGRSEAARKLSEAELQSSVYPFITGLRFIYMATSQLRPLRNRSFQYLARIHHQ